MQQLEGRMFFPSTWLFLFYPQPRAGNPPLIKWMCFHREGITGHFPQDNVDIGSHFSTHPSVAPYPNQNWISHNMAAMHNNGKDPASIL